MRLWLYISLLLIVPGCIVNSAKNSKKDSAKAPKDLLIISSVNGDLTGLNMDDGKILWRVKNTPLLSQSISNIEFNKDGRTYRIVPSLEGELYMLDSGKDNAGEDTGSSLRALPVTAESLFSAGFQLANDALIVGNKEQSIYSIDPITGKMIFNCSSGGCGSSDILPTVTIHSASEDEEDPKKTPGKGSPAPLPRILVKRHSHTVRGIDLLTGSEKWNFSVAHDHLAIVSGTGSVPKPGGVPTNSRSDRDINWLFNVDQGIVMALSAGGPLFSRFLWQQKLDSSLSSAWTLHICPTGETLLKSLSILHGAGAWRAWENGAGNPTYTTASLPHPFHSSDRPADSNPQHEHHETGSALSRLANDITPGGVRCSAKRALYLGEFQGQLYVKIEGKSDVPTWADTQQEDDEEDNTAPQWVAIPWKRPLDGEACGQRQPGGKATRSTAMQPFLQTGALYEASIDYEPAYGFIPPWGEGDQYFPFDDRPFFWPGVHWFENLILCGLVCVIIHLIIKYRSIRQVPRVMSVPLVSDPRYFEAAPNQSSVPLRCYSSQTIQEMNNNSAPRPTLSNDSGIEEQKLSSTVTPTEQSSQSPSPPPSHSVPFQSRYETDYTHVRCLARGGFGLVFQATHKIDCKDYAIKRICMKRNATIAARREKIFREATILANLEHPGIVRYFQAWVENPPDGWQEERDRQLLSKEPQLLDILSLGSDLQLDPVSATFTESLDISKQPVRQGPQDVTSDSVSDFLPPPSQRHLFDSRDDLIVFGSGDAHPVEEEDKSHPDSSDTSDDDEEEEEEEEVIGGSKVRTRLGSNSIWASKSSSKSSHSQQQQTGPAKEYLYIVMQLCKSESLRGWLASHPMKQRNKRHLLDMFVQIADALSYLHEHGLIHRDLKPSNILFDMNDRIRVVDFGLVAYDGVKAGPVNKMMETSKQQEQHTDNVGTYLYMSPEQQAGGKYNFKVDVFALGLIFMELLIEFGTDSERYVVLSNAKKQQFPDDFKKTNHEECQLIMKLLSQSPDERPSCEEILKDKLLLTAVTNMRHERVRTVSSGGSHNTGNLHETS